MPKHYLENCNNLTYPSTNLFKFNLPQLLDARQPNQSNQITFYQSNTKQHLLLQVELDPKTERHPTKRENQANCVVGWAYLRVKTVKN